LKLKKAGCELPIRSLNACQVRKKTIDSQTVERYRELLQASEPPAIVVLEDMFGRFYIADGHHRVAAALAAGRTAIRADLYHGDSHDARLAGLEANQHGLGLTLAEKKAALDELLDNAGRSFGDSTLARLTGLDRHTVEKRRRERETGDFISAAGRLRPQKTPEEQADAAARGIVKQIDRFGVEMLVRVMDLLPNHAREEAGRLLAGRKGGRT
jgi:dienelactone hydrolase